MKTGKSEPRDERDYQFEAKSHIAGYITLFTAICLLIGHVMMNEITKAAFQFEYEILNAGQISVYMLLSLEAQKYSPSLDLAFRIAEAFVPGIPVITTHEISPIILWKQ